MLQGGTTGQQRRAHVDMKGRQRSTVFGSTSFGWQRAMPVYCVTVEWQTQEGARCIQCKCQDKRNGMQRSGTALFQASRASGAGEQG